MSRDETSLSTAPSHKVGPFDITSDSDALTLRLEDRGELSAKGCLLFVVTMLIVLTLGVLAMIQFAIPTPTATHVAIADDNPGRIFEPSQNSFGYLWLFSAVAMLVAIPLYVVHVYKSALVFTFRRSDDVFLRNDRRIARLRSVEFVNIHEARDADGRYIYVLDLIYGDGREINLHTDYEERQIMNLANEISAFIGCKVKWR